MIAAPLEFVATSHTGTDFVTPSAYESLLDGQWSRAGRLRCQPGLAPTERHWAVGIAQLPPAVLPAQQRVTIVPYDADLEIAAEVLSFEQR